MANEPDQVNLENFTLSETRRQVNTPRSLEACRREGVEPSYLLYRPVESFAAPGKPQVVQEQEYQQYDNLRKNLLVKLRQIRLQLVEEQEHRKSATAELERPRTVSRRSVTVRSGGREEDENILPQLKYQYQLLRKRISKIEKEQDRECTRLYGLIGKHEKEVEAANLMDEKRRKEEEEKALTEERKHELKRQRMEQEQREREEKEQQRKVQLELDRQNAYNRMLSEIQEKMLIQSQKERDMERLLELQKKSKEERIKRKEEYLANLHRTHMIREHKRTESDVKIMERRKVYAENLKRLVEETKEKRKWREFRHIRALETVKQETSTRVASIKEKMDQEQQKTERHIASSRTTRSRMVEGSNEQIERVREEAERRQKIRLEEMLTSMARGDQRVEEQKRLSEEKIALGRMQKETQLRLKNQNVERYSKGEIFLGDRQKRKEEYRKMKLREMQEKQDEKLKQFVEGKESLYSQSQCVQLANDLRKYHLKKEIDGNPNKFLTIDKLMDINDRFRPKDIKFSASLKPKEVQRMMARIMSRPSRSNFTRGFKSSSSREKFMSADGRMSARVESNTNNM